MKIVTVVGARPQFIKAAAVAREVGRFSGLKQVLVHTGQHYDSNMSDVFFEELEIPAPNYHLGIGGGGHGEMTGRQLQAIEEVLLEERPNWVLVYGDTNSTLAGALAAVKLHIPVGHIEAGLRSFNRRMPEEINRVLTDHAATLLFAPTETAMSNLRLEGISEGSVILVGDVMYDAALFYRTRATRPRHFPFDEAENGFVLATVHRAENTDDPARLAAIMAGLGDCGRPVILPLHPRTRARLDDAHIKLGENVHVIDPVGYLEMVWLESHAEVIATDSGGVQKEAYFFSRPCVTLRDETEWVETVESGWNVLAGTDSQRIAASIDAASGAAEHPALFGDGNSAGKILKTMVGWMEKAR